MKYQGLSLACSALALAMAAPVAAQSVDFNTLADANYQTYNNPLTVGDFKFIAGTAAVESVTPQFLVWGNTAGGLSQFNPNSPGASLGINTGSNSITISRTDGAAFILNSLDFADIYNTGTAGNLSLVFTYEDLSSSSMTLSLDNLVGLQTQTFDLEAILSLKITSLTTQAGLFQIDNLSTSQQTLGPGGDGDPATAAPEPASWAMMLMGFGALGAVLRRRRASVTFA
jgi:hypothetical protein